MGSLCYTFFCLAIMASAMTNIHAITDEEKSNLRAALLPHIDACGKEFGKSHEELLEAKKSGTLDPCFIACVFKKMGVMNAEGVFDIGRSQELYKKYVHNEADLNRINSVDEKCAPINVQPVSDGNKGCERAKLVHKCYHENLKEIMVEGE